MEGTFKLEREMIYMGNEHIISPLGSGAEENFDAIVQGKTALKMHESFEGKELKFPSGIIENYPTYADLSKLESLILNTLLSCSNKAKLDNALLIITSTKGDIVHLKEGDVEKAKLSYLAQRVIDKLSFTMDYQVVSNACISGVSGIVLAHDLIKVSKYDHVVVIGADLFSDFTLKGFESFFALSEELCKPYDKDRKGLCLGEACAGVLVSKDQSIFEEEAFELLGGASSNDANHISGPSRTGEGLFRVINRAMTQAGLDVNDIDVISAHGTATRYNDDMESIAFSRAGLNNTALNSLKGYYGHTLGAAGVLETAIFMQSARKGVMLKNMGVEQVGTAEEINVQMQNEEMDINTVLKTASGFGGCNGALVFRKINA